MTPPIPERPRERSLESPAGSRSQTGDDERFLDFFLQYLRVAPQVFGNAKAVFQVSQDLTVGKDTAEIIQVCLTFERPEQDP